MKNNMLKNLKTFAIAGVLSVIALENSALGQGCCLTFPTNTPLNAFVTGYPNWSVPSGDHQQHGFTTPSSWFAVDVIDTNAAILPGIYPAWCVDQTHFLPVILTTIPGTYYSGTLISTCDALGLAYLPAHGGNPPVGPPPTVSLDTWKKVNYILNHKAGYYWWNVQVAINRLVGGLAPNDPINPPPLPTGYPPVDTNEVTAILNDVNANASTWISPCGGIVGVIYVIPDPVTNKPAQLIMLEVPCVCPTPTANCVTIDAVQGVPITPVTLVGSGGCAGAYTFSASGLPTGLTMSSGGTISGTPLASGTVSYTVTIKDSCGNQGTINCSVTVKCNGKIGDFIWQDLNGNGCQDTNEPGINGVQVSLYSGACGTTGTLIATTNTDSSGRYLFSGLCPGSYQVAITTPGGYTATTPNKGCVNPNLPRPNNQIDSKCNCAGISPCVICVTLTATNPVNLNVDCGYVCNGQIGDFVWNDLDGNGCQDAGEPGIQGVKVDLYVGCGVSGTPTMTTNTDVNGHYLFSGLCAGIYTVSFNAPAGYSRTVANAGCTKNGNPPYSNETDSKCVCAPGTPCGVCVPLTSANPLNLNVDCGYVVPPPPKLELIKSVDKNFVTPGGQATYTYIVKNSGAITITNITVVDDNGTPGDTSDDLLVATNITLAAGTSQTFTFTENLPLTMCATINGTNMVVGNLSTTVLPSGDIQVIYTQLAVNDNRYGTGATPATGWAKSQPFSNLTSSDKAEFRFTDTKGNVVFDFYVDYISAATKAIFPNGTVLYPSGYGTLGLSGGDGGLVKGGASNLLFATTSLTDNLMKPQFTNGFTVNSAPETAPLSGVSIPAGWNYKNSYTVIVSKKAFGTNGFGSVSIPLIHDSPPKIGTVNAITPTNCDNCIVNVAVVRGTAINGTPLTDTDTAEICFGTPPSCNVISTCTPPYPFASANPKTSIVFSEPECLVTNLLTTDANCKPTQIQVFYNDEHALTLGVRQVITKKKVGTVTSYTTNNYAVAPLSSNPGSVIAVSPATVAVGATVAQNGVDVSGRPIFPAMFITDITGNPANPYAGDWQYGGTPQPPTAVFGTWKGAVARVDTTVTPNTFTVTPDADPAKNNKILGPGSDPFILPAKMKTQGYSAEVRWDISGLKDNNGAALQSGHTYRLYFMVHDGDQNKTGGDVGQECGTITIP
jgi:hypothetical protein